MADKRLDEMREALAACLNSDADHDVTLYARSWSADIALLLSMQARAVEALKAGKQSAYKHFISQAPNTPPERLMLYRSCVEVFDEVLAALDASVGEP